MDIQKIMRKAFDLGQIYWQQDDSDFVSQQNKSDETFQKFEELSLAVSSDINQAKLQYDALLEALELALAELIDKAQMLQNEFGSGETVTAENLDNGDKIIAAIAAAKGE